MVSKRGAAAVLLALLAASGTGAAVLFQAVPGLVAYWAFDENAGTTTADGSGNGNTGTLQTGTAFSTTVPAVPTGNVSSLSIPDATANPGRVTVPHSAGLSITGPLTLAAWVRPTATTANQMGIIEKWDYTTSISGYFLRLGRSAVPDHYPKFDLGNGGAANFEIAQYTAMPLNTWTHLAGVYDGTNMSLYRNGTLVAGPTAAPAPGPSTGFLHIGSDYGGNRFQGQIDEARIFNVALTQAEIQVLISGMSAPTAVSLTSPEGNQLLLTWTAVPGATSYTVLRGTASGALSPLVTVTGTSYLDTTVLHPTLYFYAVVANGIMTSGRSNELSAVPLSPAPRYEDHEEGVSDRDCGCGSAVPSGSWPWALLGLAAALLALRRQ
jgi:MYXO-CTERM domain-containing protein